MLIIAVSGNMEAVRNLSTRLKRLDYFISISQSFYSTDAKILWNYICVNTNERHFIKMNVTLYKRT